MTKHIYSCNICRKEFGYNFDTDQILGFRWETGACGEFMDPAQHPGLVENHVCWTCLKQITDLAKRVSPPSPSVQSANQVTAKTR